MAAAKPKKYYQAEAGVRFPGRAAPDHGQFMDGYLQQMRENFGGKNVELREVKVPVSRAVVQGAVQSPERQRMYEDMLRAGESLPPVVVQRKGNQFHILDGLHRHAAAVASGAKVLDGYEVVPAKERWLRSGDGYRIPHPDSPNRAEWDEQYMNKVKDYFGEDRTYRPFDLPMDQVEAGHSVMGGHPRTAFYERMYRQNLGVPPVLVTKLPGGRYETLDGSRRVGAAQAAGVSHIPALELIDPKGKKRQPKAAAKPKPELPYNGPVPTDPWGKPIKKGAMERLHPVGLRGPAQQRLGKSEGGHISPPQGALMRGSAFRHRKTGQVHFTGAWHDISKLPVPYDENEWEDGFVDHQGKFYNRAEAAAAVDPSYVAGQSGLESQDYAQGVGEGIYKSERKKRPEGVPPGYGEWVKHPKYPERIQQVFDAIRRPDILVEKLRKPKYRDHPNRFTGHCYAAAEAAYHLLNGEQTGWKVRRGQHEGDTHWFLYHPKSDTVFDPTAEQFKTPVPYKTIRAAGGRPAEGGFLTKEPSKRALEIMGAVKKLLSEGLNKAEECSLDIEELAKVTPPLGIKRPDKAPDLSALQPGKSLGVLGYKKYDYTHVLPEEIRNQYKLHVSSSLMRSGHHELEAKLYPANVDMNSIVLPKPVLSVEGTVKDGAAEPHISQLEDRKAVGLVPHVLTAFLAHARNQHGARTLRVPTHTPAAANVIRRYIGLLGGNYTGQRMANTYHGDTDYPAFIKDPTHLMSGFETALKSEESLDKMAMVDQTKNPSYQEWHKDSHPITKLSSGAPKTVFHGTTHDFKSFDATNGNPEGWFGRAHYFTDDPDDVSENYAGEGPDLKSRIMQEGDRNEWEIRETHGVDAVTASNMAQEEARKKLVGPAARVIPAHLRMRNPLILKQHGGTYYDEDDGQRLARVINKVARKYNADPNDVLQHLESKGVSLWDGAHAMDIDAALRDWEGGYDMTGDNGEMLNNEFARDVWREAGHDGIVMDANHYFGDGRLRGATWGKPMDGVGPGTHHYIVFNPNQIKGVFNQTFSRSKDFGKSEPLAKAIANIPAGKLVAQNPKSGEAIYDYTHLVHPAWQGQGIKLTVRVQPKTKAMTALVTQGDEALGTTHGNWKLHNGSVGLKVHSTLIPSESWRGKRFGQSMYEALMAHAKQVLGATHMYGDEHSTEASRVHQKLARKHGLSYKPVPNIGGRAYPTMDDWFETPSHDDDGKYREYEYLLKGEYQPLDKVRS